MSERKVLSAADRPKDIAGRIAPRRTAAAAFGAAALLICQLLSPQLFGLQSARADEPVTLSIAVKDHKFDPAEMHAPAGAPLVIRIKNLSTIVAEFESSDLHFEKIVPAGGEAIVHVRPLQPGRYSFFDDFHRETQGALIVP